MSTLEIATSRETRLTSLSPTAMRGTVRNGAVLPGWLRASEVSARSPVTRPTASPLGPLPSSSLTAMSTPATPESRTAGIGGR